MVITVIVLSEVFGLAGFSPRGRPFVVYFCAIVYESWHKFCLKNSWSVFFATLVTKFAQFFLLVKVKRIISCLHKFRMEGVYKWYF